jgi:short-subunit dehydrogenase
MKGIGKIAALECAKRRAHVYMVCRDEKRGKEAQEEIIRESKNSNVELHLCDMSQPKDVFAFTKQFLQSQKPLNVIPTRTQKIISQLISCRCYVTMPDV